MAARQIGQDDMDETKSYGDDVTMVIDEASSTQDSCVRVESSTSGDPLVALETTLDRHHQPMEGVTTNGHRSSNDTMKTEPSEVKSTTKRQKRYQCHLCRYGTNSESNYRAHINDQHEIRCPKCDLRLTSDEQLQMHVFECHPGLLQEEDCTQSDVDKSRANSTSGSQEQKPKSFRCKHCPHSAVNKMDFWQHTKIHIKSEKMLSCPKCPFVTEYKHHLEYHLRNHFGSKPFKCKKCNYSCVNKSMLNSHLKSHSNVYQFRCADCNYATKYCHSLKLHLRKYAHNPASVLYPDGTPNPYPIVDVYGTRRGPRPKKSDATNSEVGAIHGDIPSNVSSSTPMAHFAPSMIPSTQTSAMQFMFHQSHLFAGYPLQTVCDKSLPEQKSPQPLPGGIRCNLCEYQTMNREEFSQHMLSHIASESDVSLTKSNSPRSDGVQSPQTPMTTNKSSSLPNSPISQQESNDVQSQGSPSTVITPTHKRFVPLDLTVGNGMRESHCASVSSPIGYALPDQANKPITEEMREKSQEVESPQSRESLSYHGESKPANYSNKSRINSYGGTDQDSSSPASMSPNDSGQKSPSTLEPMTDTLTNLMMKRQGDGQALSELLWSGVEMTKHMMQGNQLKTQTSPSPDDRIEDDDDDDKSKNDLKKDESKIVGRDGSWPEVFTCMYCDMSFRDCIMYTVHMGYHGYKDPFTCNMCGLQTDDKVSFFLHIARAAHL